MLAREIIFEIILIGANEDDYIVLDKYDDRESADLMLGWYRAHSRFFNGTIAIKEMRIY